MAFVIAGGVYLGAYFPRPAPLAPVVSLLIAAGVLLVINIVAVSRLKPFAWEVFFRVAGWALLAYIVITGLIAYIFVLDHARGTMLVVLILMLVGFAVNVPLLLAFSVARYQPVDNVPVDNVPVDNGSFNVVDNVTGEK